MAPNHLLMEIQNMNICDVEDLREGLLVTRKCSLIREHLSIECPPPEKKRIQLKDLSNVDVREQFTIEKHKYDFIICLESRTNIKFLKAENKEQMEQWYKILSFHLVERLGWVQDDNMTMQNGLMQRSKSVRNPRRQRVVARKQCSSVCTVEGGFNKSKREKQYSTDSTSSIDEWSSSDDSKTPSPTGEIAQPGYNREDPSIFNAPIQCTESKRCITSSSTFVANKHQNEVNQTNQEYMPLLHEYESNLPSNVINNAYAAQTSRNRPRQVRRSSNDHQTFESRDQRITSPPPQECDEPKFLQSNFEENTEVSRVGSGIKYHNFESIVKIRNKSPKETRPPLPPDSPPLLPARDGVALRCSMRRFNEQQQGDQISIDLSKADIDNGKRLYLEKIKGSIWICQWNPIGPALDQWLHPGDELLKVDNLCINGYETTFAYKVIEAIDSDKIRFTIRRAPHAFAVTVSSRKSDAIRIDVENNIIKTMSSGIPLKKKATGFMDGRLVDWAITEINGQSVSYYANTEQVEELLYRVKDDIALVVQPSDFVNAMKGATPCSKCGSSTNPLKCSGCRRH